MCKAKGESAALCVALSREKNRTEQNQLMEASLESYRSLYLVEVLYCTETECFTNPFTKDRCLVFMQEVRSWLAVHLAKILSVFLKKNYKLNL